MSLGIIAIWRARPLRLGLSIPRESLFIRPRPTFPLPSLSLRYYTAEETAKLASSVHKKDGDTASISDVPKPLGHEGNGNDSSDDLFEEFENLAALTEKPSRSQGKPMPKLDATDDSSTEEIRDIESELERSHFTRSVLVEPFKPYPTHTQTRASRRRHHKSVTAQVLLDRNQETLGSKSSDWLPDWRVILGLIAKHTPEEPLEWIENGMKIEAPRTVIAQMLEDIGDDNIGAIRKRTGAAIKVSQDQAALVVSGSRQAINRATEEVRRIVGRITITPLYSSLGPDEVVTEVRSEGDEEALSDAETKTLNDTLNFDQFFTPPLTREEGAYYPRRKTEHHVFATPLPSVWTPRTVEQYVATLVDSDILSHLEAPLYMPFKGSRLLDHEGAVVERLDLLLHAVPTRLLLSCSALKLALSFMCEVGSKYLPTVRKLFTLMDQRGLRMDTDIYNILLKAAVKTRDLRKFQQTMFLMTKRGHVPNLDTWFLFLRIFESAQVKSYILRAMHMKNLLSTPDAIQRVAEEMSKLDTEHALTEGKELKTFLEEQEERYGSQWLTRDMGNQVLDVFCRHGRFRDAFELLDLMATHHASIPPEMTHEKIATKPDASTFNTIISHAKIKKKMPLAVNVLHKMKTEALGKQYDSLTLHLLFEIAWKMRLRSTIAVIWRYASLARITSWRMRYRVATLLQGKIGSGNLEMSEAMYRELGGEILARELAGGEEALSQIRLKVEKSFGDKDPITRHRKLAVLASKALPLAFEGFSPTVALGEVLSQSILVDIKCLRARKSGQLVDLLKTAKVKSLPLQRRQPHQQGWVDLAPLQDIEPGTIGIEDVWEDEWESEGWKVTSAFPRLPTENPPEATSPDLSHEGDDPSGDSMGRQLARTEPDTEKHMAIINPNVWTGNGYDDDSILSEALCRNDLQRQNEEVILAALAALDTTESGKDYLGFRYTLFGPVENTASEGHIVEGAEDEAVTNGTEQDTQENTQDQRQDGSDK